MGLLFFYAIRSYIVECPYRLAIESQMGQSIVSRVSTVNPSTMRDATGPFDDRRLGGPVYFGYGSVIEESQFQNYRSTHQEFRSLMQQQLVLFPS